MAIVIGNMMTKHQIWRGTYFDKSPYRPKLKGTFKNLWYTFLGMSYNGNGDRKDAGSLIIKMYISSKNCEIQKS